MPGSGRSSGGGNSNPLQYSCLENSINRGAWWPEKAVENALVLDECARMALITRQFNPEVPSAPQEILDKHYYRKHGAGAYYGQK